MDSERRGILTFSLVVRTGDSIGLTAKEAETETSSPWCIEYGFRLSHGQDVNLKSWYGILCVEALG